MVKKKKSHTEIRAPAWSSQAHLASVNLKDGKEESVEVAGCSGRQLRGHHISNGQWSQVKLLSPRTALLGPLGQDLCRRCRTPLRTAVAPGFMTLVKPSENRAVQPSLLLTDCLSSAPSPSFPIESFANLILSWVLAL